MLSLILIGTFLTVVLIIIGMYGLFFSDRIEALSRLKKYTAEEGTDIITSKIKSNGNNKYLFEVFGVIGRITSGSSHLDKRKKKLTQAAILLKPEEFIGVSLMNAVALSILFYMISKSIIIALILIPIGFILPELFLERKKSKRMAKINAQLPEALNVISNGLRAGFSFTQAIGIVTDEMSGPISEEFTKVLRSNVLGKSIEEALSNMSERTDDEDLDIVITALIIQRQVGGNLAEVLDSISGTIRERVKIKADIKTLTAQGRISGIVVSLLPVALGIVLSAVNPGYLGVLFTTFIGKIMVIGGITLQLIGIFILMKLVDIKV